MKMPLFGVGLQSDTPVVTAKLLQNFYVEFRPEGEKSRVVARGFPGLDLFVDVGDTPWRGPCIEVQQNSLLYGVHRAKFKEVNNAGVVVDRGTLNTSVGFVSMAHDGERVVVVDGTDGYRYNIATTTFVQITDVDFPVNPTSIDWLNGFFIAGFDNGTFYLSEDGLAWDALDFATAEASPDRLVRNFVDHGEVILFGDVSTEFWGISGSLDLPFSKLQGTDAEWGLAARASAVKFDDSVAFLCKNRLGQVLVGKIAGHAVQKLSTPDMDRIINSYASVSDATAYSYLLDGHSMYQINFPSAGYSWSFDGLTGIWSKRKSFGVNYHRGLFATQFLSKTVISDATSGRLYRMNPETLTENGEAIEGEITGEHWDNELEWLQIDKIRLDWEVGPNYAIPGSLTTWDGEGTLWVDPDTGTQWDYQEEAAAQCMLQISRDDGKSWGIEQWKSIGLLGNYGHVVEWRRLGRARRYTIRARVTDPIKKVLTGCYINPKS